MSGIGICREQATLHPPEVCANNGIYGEEVLFHGHSSESNEVRANSDSERRLNGVVRVERRQTYLASGSSCHAHTADLIREHSTLLVLYINPHFSNTYLNSAKYVGKYR